ncbi:hypothetical protein [Cutibacterium acnes]|uniref:hypothetical protein n=1 Tax=Cutibacterium acnes TaxID=1747 RepID=UPI0005170187|nr:hypothetical protein [Cutibacterium acnes]
MMRSVYLTNESCGLVARQAASHSKVIFASLQVPETEYAKSFTLVALKRVGCRTSCPRPGAEITSRWRVERPRLFTDRGLLVAFILAEMGLRAPLRRGLPNLEYERYGNAWIIVLHRTGPAVTLTEEELPNETRSCDDEKEQDYVFLGS